MESKEPMPAGSGANGIDSQDANTGVRTDQNGKEKIKSAVRVSGILHTRSSGIIYHGNRSEGWTKQIRRLGESRSGHSIEFGKLKTRNKDIILIRTETDFFYSST